MIQSSRMNRRSTSLVLQYVFLLSCLIFITGTVRGNSPKQWVVDQTAEWKAYADSAGAFSLKSGSVHPNSADARFTSKLKLYAEKRQPAAVTFTQTPEWTGWTQQHVEPKRGSDAPILLVTGEDDYWYLNALNGGGPYSVWHSTDMENWELHKNTIGKDWVTTAEYAEGIFFVYYDEPNDQDPHLVLTKDLTNKKKQEKGEAFADPSHGSDMGVFRAADGSFHMFYEDWSPIDASSHSWDSPLAGHTSSPDGIKGFTPHKHPAPIDERTAPLPEFGTFGHPSGKLKYHKHNPEQDAFGDYTMIKIGDRYYLFCDYEPADGPMRLAYWVSDSLYEPFEWGGSMGKGFHPDPSVGFAEGKFYVLAQGHKDFVSPGPWTKKVSARVGVDTNGDKSVDQWMDWQVVQPEYRRKPGFARIVEESPAGIDLSSLPAGQGFRFEFKTSAPSSDAPKPAIDSVKMTFE